MEFERVYDYLRKEMIIEKLYFLFLYSGVMNGFIANDELVPITMKGEVNKKNLKLSKHDQEILAEYINLFNYLFELEKCDFDLSKINQNLFIGAYEYYNAVKQSISIDLRKLILDYSKELNDEEDTQKHRERTLRIIVDKINDKFKIQFKYQFKYHNGSIYPAGNEVYLIESVDDYLNAIYSIQEIEGNDKLFFRGHANWTYQCIPSLFRKDDWKNNEKEMKELLTIHCPKEIDNRKSTFDKLVLMQHYDLPTRLMDLTSNPLVALFFASNEEVGKANGEVIIYDVPKEMKTTYSSQDLTMISCLSELTSTQRETINNELRTSTIDPNPLVDKCMAEIPNFSLTPSVQTIKRMLFVQPKLNNDRVERQSGAFLIAGLLSDKEVLFESSKLKVKKHMLIIDKNSKEKILKQLSILSIDQAKLFPEIDSVAKHIKSIWK